MLDSLSPSLTKTHNHWHQHFLEHIAETDSFEKDLVFLIILVKNIIRTQVDKVKQMWTAKKSTLEKYKLAQNLIGNF